MDIRNIASRAILALVLAVPVLAQASVFTENFDSYATNSTIIGQGGWQGWDQNPAADATVVDTVSVSPPNSLRITGTSDAVHTFSGYVAGKWVFRTMQYVSSTSVGDSYFILLNKYVDGSHLNPDWSVQLRARASDNTMYSVEGLKTLPLIEDAWVEIRCEIDLDANTVSIYYNNQLLAATPWYQTGGQAQIQAVDLYSDNVASLAYYDNISLEPLATTEVLAPGTLTVNLGKVTGGDVASLAADDNNALTVCKFFVPSFTSPILRFTCGFTTTKAAPTAIQLDVKAKMNNAGSFAVRGFLHDYVNNLDVQVIPDTAIALAYATFSGTATGTLTNFVGASNAMQTKVEVQQTGPSTQPFPCASFELVNLKVTG